MADQLICQTVFARCSKRVNLLNFYPTKLSHYTILKFCDLKIPYEISKNNKPRNSTYTAALYVPVRLFSLNLFTYTRALPSSSQLVTPKLISIVLVWNFKFSFSFSYFTKSAGNIGIILIVLKTYIWILVLILVYVFFKQLLLLKF